MSDLVELPVSSNFGITLLYALWYHFSAHDFMLPLLRPTLVRSSGLMMWKWSTSLPCLIGHSLSVATWARAPSMLSSSSEDWVSTVLRGGSSQNACGTSLDSLSSSVGSRKKYNYHTIIKLWFILYNTGFFYSLWAWFIGLWFICSFVVRVWGDSGDDIITARLFNYVIWLTTNKN